MARDGSTRSLPIQYLPISVFENILKIGKSVHYVHCTINSDRQVTDSRHRQTASGYLDATVSKIKEMTNLRELCHSLA